MLKKEVKKADRKQLDEKIKKMILKRTIHIICPNQYANWKGHLMVVKNPKKDKSTKRELVLKIWK